MDFVLTTPLQSIFATRTQSVFLELVQESVHQYKFLSLWFQLYPDRCFSPPLSSRTTRLFIDAEEFVAEAIDYESGSSCFCAATDYIH